MKILKRPWWLAAAAAAIAALAAVTVVTRGASAAPSKAARPGQATGLGQTSGLLPRSHLTVESAIQVGLTSGAPAKCTTAGPNRFCCGVGLSRVTVCTAAGSPIAMLASLGA